MREIANISMMILPNGEPGVKLSAGDDFLDVSPLARVTLLIAAVQLCGAAIVAICEDNPDDAIDIEEMMDCMSIIPSVQSVN